MNHSDKQIIPIVSGFKCKTFPQLAERMIPSEQMLIELLRPGTNPDTAIFHQFDLNHSNQIPDLESQLLLQKYSNDLVDRMTDHEYLNLMCEKLDINPQEAQYHGFVQEYISNLFPGKIPNINKDTPAAVEMVSTYCLLQSDSEILHMGKIFEALTGANFKAQSNPENEHELDLKHRFADYRESSDYINKFISKCDRQ
jgi:hypothetical protein